MNKPAIEGGKPIRSSFLLFGSPRITTKEIREVIDTIKSRWIGTGPKTHTFEEAFRKYIGSKYAVALNSCTAGLHLALDVLGVGPGDEVITTPLTFPSTANVIIHHHAKPVFADIDPNTWNIDPQKISEKIKKNTKVLIPVHLHGRPCDMDAIKNLSMTNNLHVVEDAAHAAESVYHGKKIGTISDFTAFSFYVTKNIMTGEGGMLTTNNKSWADEARIRSLHGISKDAWKRYSSSGFQPYETIYPGYKYNMIDLVASFGIHQLKDVERNLKVREIYWSMYDEAFQDDSQISPPPQPEPHTRHARHLYAILLKPGRLKISRNQFIESLQLENIGVGIHFTPLHLHHYYRKTFGYKEGDFPYSEDIGQRIVSLPLSASMSKRDVEDVIKGIKKLTSYYKKVLRR